MSWGDGNNDNPTTWGASRAVGGRWGELVGEALGLKDETPLVYDYGEHDYQGSCSFIAKTGDDEFLIYAWSYGSCSGCDAWEDDVYDYRGGEEGSGRKRVIEEIQDSAKRCNGVHLAAYLAGIARRGGSGTPSAAEAALLLVKLGLNPPPPAASVQVEV